MVQQMPTNRELLRAQSQLPDRLKQSCILLEFKRPIPRIMTGEFLRVHLTRNMLAGGENDFYMPEVYQPHRMKPRKCPVCWTLMRNFAFGRSKCVNASCKRVGQEQQHAPVRGVVKVLIFPDFVTHTDGGKEWVNKALIVLDRRYRDEVLAAVKRTCVELGEPYDWGVK